MISTRRRSSAAYEQIEARIRALEATCESPDARLRQPRRARRRSANEPNFDADISDVIERKIEALLAHPSQFPVEDEDFLQQMRVNWRGDDGRYVEAFRRVIMFM